jgi:hypothetical protein
MLAGRIVRFTGRRRKVAEARFPPRVVIARESG